MSELTTWHLLATGPKLERRMADRLRHIGYASLLLTHTEIVRRRRQRRVVERVLFPGYLFFGIDGDANWFRLRELVEGCRVIYDDGAPAVMRPSVIADLQSAMIGGVFDYIDERAYEVGKPVKIMAGPLTSVPGLIDALISRDRARVLVELFGRSSIVEVPLDQVKPL